MLDKTTSRPTNPNQRRGSLRGEGDLIDVVEIEGCEADEGAVAGDLVDDEVGVALLEGAAEARYGGGEAGDADVGLGQGPAARRGRGRGRMGGGRRADAGAAEVGGEGTGEGFRGAEEREGV
jgi:hypothetical protein